MHPHTPLTYSESQEVSNTHTPTPLFTPTPPLTYSESQEVSKTHPPLPIESRCKTVSHTLLPPYSPPYTPYSPTPLTPLFTPIHPLFTHTPYPPIHPHTPPIHTHPLTYSKSQEVAVISHGRVIVIAVIRHVLAETHQLTVVTSSGGGRGRGGYGGWGGGVILPIPLPHLLLLHHHHGCGGYALYQSGGHVPFVERS